MVIISGIEIAENDSFQLRWKHRPFDGD